MAAHSNTTVMYVCTDSDNGTVVLESAGKSNIIEVRNSKWQQLDSSTYCYIESDKPILITQLGPGAHYMGEGNIGDVVMSIIPPVDVNQYSNSITFYRPDYSYWDISHHYINIYYNRKYHSNNGQ